MICCGILQLFCIAFIITWIVYFLHFNILQYMICFLISGTFVSYINSLWKLLSILLSLNLGKFISLFSLILVALISLLLGFRIWWDFWKSQEKDVYAKFSPYLNLLSSSTWNVNTIFLWRKIRSFWFGLLVYFATSIRRCFKISYLN